MNKFYEKEGSLGKLQAEIARFAAERDWDQYHTPKNLAMALSVEVSELLEIFQWLTVEESRTVDEKTRAHIEEEIGDVMIYLTTLAGKFDMDPLTAAFKKMKLNAKKYPAPDQIPEPPQPDKPA